MENLYRKVSYLKGLVDGSELRNKGEAAVNENVVDVLEEIVEYMGDLFFAYEELEDYVKILDDDLEFVELEVFDIEDEDFDFDEEEEED